jgi:hypothetical protein
MRGQILDFSIQTNSGAITGADGGRYTFTGAEWKGNGVPTRGMWVDFRAEGPDARELYLVPGVAPVGQQGAKDKTAAGLLAIFLGGWGIHK